MSSKHIRYSRRSRRAKTNPTVKSTVTKAHTTSPSVRTTIPHDIIDMLGWDTGDVLSWTIEKRGKKYVVKVRRLE